MNLITKTHSLMFQKAMYLTSVQIERVLDVQMKIEITISGKIVGEESNVGWGV